MYKFNWLQAYWPNWYADRMNSHIYEHLKNWQNRYADRRMNRHIYEHIKNLTKPNQNTSSVCE